MMKKNMKKTIILKKKKEENSIKFEMKNSKHYLKQKTLLHLIFAVNQPSRIIFPHCSFCDKFFDLCGKCFFVLFRCKILNILYFEYVLFLKSSRPRSCKDFKLLDSIEID